MIKLTFTRIKPLTWQTVMWYSRFFRHNFNYYIRCSTLVQFFAS